MDFIDSLKEKNIHIVGICGAETSAIARYLFKSGCDNITLHDFNTPDEFKNIFDISHISHNRDEREKILRETLDIPATKNFKNDYLNDIMTADLIFVGQNWFNYDFNRPALFDAKEAGIPFYTITELYFKMIPAPIIGVTGTNGKTTTSNLILHIFETAGRRVYFSGNDRYSKQILEQIDSIKQDDAVVLEVSNRQLTSLESSPHIAVVTNIAHDHIEEHGSFESYIDVKKKLFIFQTENDYAIINFDNEIARAFATVTKAKPLFYSVAPSPTVSACLKNGYLCTNLAGEEITLVAADELRIKGSHNISNALAASLAALLSGVSPLAVSNALKSFGGVKNRLEFVREVSGIKFYNDISSTSPPATIAAIKAFDAPVILIGGGVDKNMEFAELCGLIDSRVKKAIFLPGSATDKITERLKSFEAVESLQIAVELAYKVAEEGDVVVLSPAAASFFTLYSSGKKGFNRAVKRLKRK